MLIGDRDRERIRLSSSSRGELSPLDHPPCLVAEFAHPPDQKALQELGVTDVKIEVGLLGVPGRSLQEPGQSDGDRVAAFGSRTLTGLQPCRPDDSPGPQVTRSGAITAGREDQGREVLRLTTGLVSPISLMLANTESKSTRRVKYS